jgi:hypothetical protein
MTPPRSKLRLLAELAGALAVVVCWGAGVTALTMLAWSVGAALGIAVALACILATLFAVEVNR